MISSLRCAGPIGLVAALPDELAFSPGVAHGIWSLRRFDPVAPGAIVFPRSRAHMPFSSRTSHGLWRSVFCPVITCLPQEELLSLAMCGFWGLAPSTSRAITVAGPAIALKRAARPCRPILPWVLFPLAGHQARFPQSLGAAGFVPRARGNRSDTSVSLAPTAPGQ